MADASPRRWQPVFLPEPNLRPRGAYSPAVRAGNLIFVSGQVPRNPETGAVEGTDVTSQTKRVLENVRLTLQAAGATFEDVVSVTVYLADIKDWDTFNAIYKDTFTPPYPTRTALGAQLHDVLVEVNAIAMAKGP
jgi:2-iminobutanoate/2-iminopropanoate deaminase